MHGNHHDFEGRPLSLRMQGLNCCGSKRRAGNKHSQSYGHSSIHRALLQVMEEIRNALKAARIAISRMMMTSVRHRYLPADERSLPLKGDFGTSRSAVLTATYASFPWDAMRYDRARPF